MFMPHFGQGGRTSKQVMYRSMLGGSFCSFPPGSVIDCLETAGDHCHPDCGHNDRFGSVLFGLGCPAAEKKVALNMMDAIQFTRVYTTNRL
jgi:hypothetical protein